MFTKVQVSNIGLAKISSSFVTRLDPPRSSLERHISAGYEHWKRSELAKRRWLFATEDDYPLALDETLTDVNRPFKYRLPAEALRPLRDSRTEWQQRKRFIRSNQENLKISFIENVTEEDFDPLFVEVMGARVALESVVFVTLSNPKGVTAQSRYDRAVADAAKVNAFVRGPENVGADDNDYSFITARY